MNKETRSEKDLAIRSEALLAAWDNAVGKFLDGDS